MYPPLPGMYFATEKPYEFLSVTVNDRIVSGIVLGWTMGFGFFVGWKALRETRRVGKINTYSILIWGELIASLVVAAQAFIYTQTRKPGFWFFFFIVISWALQVQFLLQIIVNRLCILLDSNKKRMLLRVTVAGAITFINLSVFAVWMPAKLQISHTWIMANIYWDRGEKVIYLIVDAGLNYYFIRTVRQRLIEHSGPTKYRRLVRFNTQMVIVSLGLDVLIISMMSMPNEMIYLAFHPVAYLGKLNIEMTMSNLIIKVARETGITVDEDSTTNADKSGALSRNTNAMQVSVHVTRTQHQHADEIGECSRFTSGCWMRAVPCSFVP